MRAFFAAFLGYATALLLSSRDLFTRVVYEEGDAATVSILVLAAKKFDLLVGNYSRVGFHHPGPAIVYVQAFGEWLFHDVLHLVPSPWNGQAIAILLLNAVLLALVLSIVFDWYPSWTLMAGLGGASLLFFTAYTELVASLWLPFVYFAPFLAFLAAATSVAAGRGKHLWILALAGGLLVHGHAEFLFFVPLIAGFALWRLWRLSRTRRKSDPGHGSAGTDRDGSTGTDGDTGNVRVRAGSSHGSPSGESSLDDGDAAAKPLVVKRDWWLFGAIIALFLSTIVLNTVVNWPGEIGKYFSYGGGQGMHAPWRAAAYVVQFWGPNQIVGAIILLTLFPLVWWLSRGRTFLRTGWHVSALAVVLVLIYAMIGIDHLHERYVGIFSFATPLWMFFLGLAGLAQRVRHWKYFGIGLLVVGIVVSGLSESLRNRRMEMQGIPSTLDTMQAQAGTRPIVLERQPDTAWAEAAPLALAGHRRGMRVCFADPAMELLVTKAFLCTPDELRAGVRYTVTRKDSGTPQGEIVGDLGPSLVSRATAG